jgi:hypothetical protein
VANVPASQEPPVASFPVAGTAWVERLAGTPATAGFQVVGQAPGLVAGPGLKGEYELALLDQAVPKREQSEEEMAVGGGSHGVVPIVVGRAGAGAGLRGRPRDQVASGRLSQVRH